MHIGIVVNVFFLLLFVLFILFSFIEEWHCWVRAGHDRNLPSLVCVLIPNRLFTRAMPAIGLHVTFSGRQMWTNVLREVTVKMKRALKDRWSSISNDVIDWPLYPTTYCCARVRNLLLFFFFFFHDPTGGRCDTWARNGARVTVRQASRPGKWFHEQWPPIAILNFKMSVLLRSEPGSLLQHYLGEAAVILPEVYRHSFVEEAELEPVLRLCLLDPSFPALVEKVEGELRKLCEEWRISTTAEGRKVKLVHNVFSSTGCVGCTWCRGTFFFSFSCFFLLKENHLSQSWRYGAIAIRNKKKKAWFIFRLFYSEKKYWSHSNVWSWLYTLVPLSPLQCRSISTMTHLDRWYWNGRHAATAVTFAMPASKWSHNFKASLSKTNCSPHIYLRIHIA